MFRLREPYTPFIVGRRPRASGRAIVGVGSVRVGGVADDLDGANTVEEVDAVYRRYLRSGNVPSWIKTSDWIWVTTKNDKHTLEFLVPSNYGSVGPDGSPLIIGKSSQKFAQEYADAFNAIIASQRLLEVIECAADVQIPYIPVQKGGMADDSTAAVIKANDLFDAALTKKGSVDGDGLLKISGSRKAFVTRPNLDGNYIAIYGGRWTVPCGAIVQPTSGHAHTEPSAANKWTYSDASHGLVLVSRKARLDGVDVDIVNDVFLSDDPSVVSLVSSEGSFDPHFPNSGSAVLGKYSGGEEEYGVTKEGEEKPAKPTYKVDASVASVQKALLDLGYDVGGSGADGKMGPDTVTAISAFRRDHALPDGGIDDALVAALDAAVGEKVGASASGGYTTYAAIGAALVLAFGVAYYLT